MCQHQLYFSFAGKLPSSTYGRHEGPCVRADNGGLDVRSDVQPCADRLPRPVFQGTERVRLRPTPTRDPVCLRFHIPQTGGWVFCLLGESRRMEISYSLGRGVNVLPPAEGRVSRLMSTLADSNALQSDLLRSCSGQRRHLVSREITACVPCLRPLSRLLAPSQTSYQRSRENKACL